MAAFRLGLRIRQWECLLRPLALEEISSLLWNLSELCAILINLLFLYIQFFGSIHNICGNITIQGIWFHYYLLLKICDFSRHLSYCLCILSILIIVCWISVAILINQIIWIISNSCDVCHLVQTIQIKWITSVMLKITPLNLNQIMLTRRQLLLNLRLNL